MKNAIVVIVLMTAALLIASFFNQPERAKFTNVTILNTSSLDSVKVFVTLQSPNSVIGLFGIKDTIGSCSKGYFYAKKGNFYKSNTSKPLLGVVVSFIGDNLPCQVAIQEGFLTGINIFEFSINVPFEVFDISCEDGVNCVLEESVSDSLWTTGDGKNIKKFITAKNKLSVGNNLNIRGVFPYRCTDCIDKSTAVPENCLNLKDTCSTFRTCQVTRTNHNGGNITVEFTGSR